MPRLLGWVSLLGPLSVLVVRLCRCSHVGTFFDGAAVRRDDCQSFTRCAGGWLVPGIAFGVDIATDFGQSHGGGVGQLIVFFHVMRPDIPYQP